MNFVFCAELDSVRPPTQILFFLYFQGEVQALFLRHEGYLGAIGAFLKGAEEDSKEKATNSNYFAQFDVNRATVCIDEY